MMIKKGDRVRFLNATGGGIVTRIDEKNNLMYIEDADGFEIPTLIRDCVVVPQVNEKTNFPKKDFSSKVQNDEPQQSAKAIQMATQPEKYEVPAIEITETPEGETLKVYLAFIPEDIKKLQTTPCSLHLINDSNYFLYYNIICSKNEKEYVSAAQGMIEPNVLDQVAMIPKDELNNWENTRVQIIAFKQNKNFTPQNAIDINLKIDTVKFYKLHSFTENEFFDEEVLLIDLIAETEKTRLREIPSSEIKNAMLVKEKQSRPRIVYQSSIRKPEVIEVDLHINELVDTTAGMSNADMLQLQLDKFHKALDENKNRKGQKIVFIHGKGEGVLRNEIEKLLKTRYKNYYYQDASFREYGFGATMVTIK